MRQFSVVKELSGEGLQILSTALGIHLGFWAWVISDDASDGFWLNTHSEYVTQDIRFIDRWLNFAIARRWQDPLFRFTLP